MIMQHIKRKLISLGILLPLLNALGSRQALAMGQKPPRPTLTPAQQRLQNMGLVLVVDAVKGAEMLGVEFFADDSEVPFYARSLQRLNGRAIMAFPSGTVPEKVRVIWRDSTKIVGRLDKPHVDTYAGNVLGDHSFPVASRIPDDVVKEIRRNGGGLRLKFRLHPDGVLFGWDIERISGGLPHHSMAGGDFQEAEIFNGRAVRKGWYLDPKTGRRIETEF